MSARTRAYLFLLGTAIIWGAAGPVIKYTLRGIDPLPFLAYRFTLSAIVALIYLLCSGTWTHILKSPLLILIYGFLAVPISLGLLFLGIDNSTVLEVALTTAIGPMIVLIAGVYVYKDRITIREKKGIAIAIMGTLILNFAPILTSQTGKNFSGNIFIFLYLITDTIAIIMSKKLTRNKIPAAVLSNSAFLFAPFFIMPLVVTSYSGNIFATITNLPLQYHLGVWYMAFISGMTAYYFLIRGLKSIEVSEAGLFWYLHPVFGIPLAIYWLGEPITTEFIIGAIIIAIGVLVAEVKKR